MKISQTFVIPSALVRLSPPLPFASLSLIIRRSWSSARCSWGTWRLSPDIGFDGRRSSVLWSSSSPRSRRRLWPPGRGRNRSGRSISGLRAGPGCTQPGFWPTAASYLWACCGCSREWSSVAVSSRFTSILSQASETHSLSYPCSFYHYPFLLFVIWIDLNQWKYEDYGQWDYGLILGMVHCENHSSPAIPKFASK